MVIEITTILDKSLRESIHNFSIHGSIHNFLQFLGSLIKYPVYRPPPPFLLSSVKIWGEKRLSVQRLSWNSASFSKFSCSSPSPHPIQSCNWEKILETWVQCCLWGEGRGRVCVNWKTPLKFKSIPTFVHDCSLPSSSLLCTVLVSRISESEPGQYVVCNGHAMTAAENRTCMVTLLLSDFTSRTC